MRIVKYISLLMFVLGIPATVFAQINFPGKGLAFAQIAIGGGYESVLTVTNRGTSAYSGILTLLPTDSTKPFPALVNGNPVSAQRFAVNLNPGDTASLKITSGDPSAGILSGFATMNAMNPGSTGLLEGNLTYYLKAANGTIVDSVGVPSTSPMLQAVVPFDDFKAVALALANLSAQPSTITLTLFDNKNAQVGVATHTLGNNQQVPRFLSQFFPSVSLTSGRVEIQSNVPFVGTALTFIEGGQASSIPFLSPVRLYDVTVNFSGGTETAQVFLSINSGYVTGYIVDTQHYDPQQPFGQQADRLTGLFVGGNLELFLHESRGQSNETVAYLQIPGFNPLQRTQSGTVLVYLVNPPGVAVRANLTMTAAN